jgi:hypothetical protein
MSKVLGTFLSKLTTKLALTLAVVTLMTPMAQAQLYRGAVTGSVTDPQDAAIADVQVIVTNRDTGVAMTTTTNGEGVYRLPVDAGTYAVDFTKMGFQTYKFGTVEVTSAKDATVNAKLTVGAVSSQVHVTAEALELDKSSATVRLTLPGVILDEIPLGTSSLVPGGSRNFARYALFTPGIARVLFQNETSALGHRGRENNYMLDGTDNNDQSVTLPALFVPPEAIREVDVQAAPFSAEYGRNIGAQINVITKSGTNRYTGEVWEFYRGNALEPLSLSSRIAGQTRPPRLVDNQFGGAFGGPIIKNKTFVFGMVQGNLLRTGPRAQAGVTIPTPTGYASLLTAPLRSTPTAQSAASRQAILDSINFLPGVHSTITNFDSTSTATVNGTAIQMGTFRPVIPSRQNIWYGLMRVDHELTGTSKLTYRGHVDRRISPLSTGFLAFDGRWGVDTKYFGQNHFLGYTTSLGSNFVNEARVTYTRLFPSFEERDKVHPTINITNAFQIGGSSNFPQERLEQTYQFQNVSTYIVSRHSLRFGFDISRTKLINNSAGNSRGTWNFTSLENFMNSTPSSLSYLLSAPLRFSFHQVRQAYFIQDDFKVTRNLTANFGLRYETSSVPLGFLGATTTEVLNALGQPPTKRDKNNWGPRVGFAYSPESDSGLLGKLLGDGRSSIRGGFGIGYDVLFYSLIASGPAQNYPRQDSQSFTGASTVDIFPTLPPKSTNPSLTISSVLINIPSDAQNPTSHYWTLSLQRKLLSDYVVELGYNGNRSYHLIRQSQFNPGVLSAAKAAAVIAGCTSANLGTCQDPVGFPRSPGAPTTTDSGRMVSTWGNRTLLETTGRNAYHGLYMQFTGRTNFGLRFGANYTWSSTLSDSEEFSNDAGTPGSSDGGIAGSTPQVPQDYFNKNNDWSRSVFDRPHRFTLNYNYDIPWFRNTGAVLNQIFEGWKWSGITEMQSGQPFTIRTGVDAVGNGATAGSRPNYNPNGTITLDPVTGDFRTFVTPINGSGIVSAPFVQNPTTGTITFLRNSMPGGGNLGRNTFRGPGYVNFNMSISKRFTLPGERQLTLRGDFINVFNHDNFPNPSNNMSDPNFGKQVWLPLTDARQVLIGAKLAF